jgi:hypothetical protein
MSNENIVSLAVVRQIKKAAQEDLAYQAEILSMTKAELLEEMVRFQEERTRLGQLTLPMMVRGKYLFKALEESSESRELKNLTRAYKRHLEYELKELLKIKA